MTRKTFMKSMAAAAVPGALGGLAASPRSAAAQPAGGSSKVTPFKIRIDDAVLEDLKHRLAQTRFPDELDNVDWDYGTDLAYLKELVAYWRTKFDWRKQEERLNGFPQFKTEIDDSMSISFTSVPSMRTRCRC